MPDDHHGSPALSAQLSSRGVDIAFAALAFAVASFALVQAPAGFPLVVGVMLTAVAVATLLRGLLVADPMHRAMTLPQLAVAAVCMLAVHYAWRQPPMWLALRLGPPEYAALILFELSVAIALSVSSRLRALGMALVGLLLGLIGTDLATGAERFTLGLSLLVDGIPVPLAALGIVVVADAAVCAVSPSLTLRLYARNVRGAHAPRLSGLGDGVVRLCAVAAIAAAGYWAYRLNNSAADIVILAALGVFGICARLLGLNRLPLLLAMGTAIMLEENVRRSLLLSRGDFAIFVQRPSGGVLAGACLVLCVAAALSLAGRRSRRAADQSGSQLKMSADRSSG